IWNNCQEYSLDEPNPSLAWTKIPCPSSVWAIGYNYYKTAINPDNQNIIIIGGGTTNTLELDPSTKQYSKVGRRRATVMADYTVADLDPVRRRMYSLSKAWGKGVLAVDIDRNPMLGRIIRGSKLPANLGKNACFVHHPPSGLMVAWSGGRKVWTFDPDSAAWTLYDNASGGAPTSSHANGPLGKCVYVRELDVFAAYNNQNEGVWLYRLP
ncbi:MAG: hypothetical protein ACTSXZ_06655, partial [Alphaproteobacteria bacterium]